MSSEAGAREQEPRSVGELFYRAVDRFDELIAMRYRDSVAGEWVDIDWRRFLQLVESLGASLIRMGVTHGDRVAILSASRAEWELIDIATMTIGAVTVPIYHSNMPDDVRYVLDHAEAKVVFAEDREQLGKVLEVRGELPGLEHAVLIDGKVSTPGFVLGYSKLLEEAKETAEENSRLVRERMRATKREDMASIVYTSGTTGRPKGVVLNQHNLLWEIDNVAKALPVDTNDETLLFLPMAHIFARLGYLLHLEHGFTISFAESIERLMDNLAEVRPTFMFSVPRIYEKVYTAVISGVQSGSRLKRQIFAFAMAVGRAVSRRKQNNQWVPPHLALSFQAAELLVFNKLKRTFGGELVFFISGGAPLAREIAEFFHAAGMLVLEGYGLTENVAAACVNRPDLYKFGYVGPPVPGVEIKIAGDGEVLVSGGCVFVEYYKREDATRETIDEDGWLHTGDIGELDKDGFLKITDRKKDLIVTSGGKNIAPQNIENLLKMIPIVSQVMVYGDKRNYLTALLTLDPDQLKQWAERHEIEYEDISEVCSHPDVRAKVEREVDKCNKNLASYETIKKFAILDEDFEVGEELTPTLKVKRKVTTEKYWEILDGLYSDKQQGASHG